MICSARSDHQEIGIIVIVTTPESFVQAGMEVMAQRYQAQQERERVERELRDAQAACAALFSAG